MNRRYYRIYINALMKNFNKYKSQRELLIELFREAFFSNYLIKGNVIYFSIYQSEIGL